MSATTTQRNSHCKFSIHVMVVVIVFVSGFEVMVCRRCVVRRCLQMVFARRVLLFRHENSSCER